MPTLKFLIFFLLSSAGRDPLTPELLIPSPLTTPTGELDITIICCFSYSIHLSFYIALNPCAYHNVLLFMIKSIPFPLLFLMTVFTATFTSLLSPFTTKLC